MVEPYLVNNMLTVFFIAPAINISVAGNAERENAGLENARPKMQGW